jgi:hypothetical protein
LCFPHAPYGRRREFLAIAPRPWRCGYWRCGGLGGSTIEHLAKFGDLIVDLHFLLFKPYDGGFDDIAIQVGYWHMALSECL